MDTILAFVVAPLGFVGLWAGVTLGLAFFSGWTSLAATYRGELASVGRRETMASGTLNHVGIPVGYSNCLTVAVGPEGVQLSVFAFFRLGAPRLLFPWSDIDRCRSYKVLKMFDHFDFRVADVTITLSGRAARMLAEEVERGAVGPALAT